MKQSAETGAPRKSVIESTENLHMEDRPQRMLDPTDGLEAAKAGKKRMLEGNAPGGPQGKCRKQEERGVNTSNALGLA